jgi:hypothetical protein
MSKYLLRRVFGKGLKRIIGISNAMDQSEESF